MDKFGCPKANFGLIHWQGDSLTYSMLTITLYLTWSKGHWGPWHEAGFQSLANHIIRVQTLNLHIRSWSNDLVFEVLDFRLRGLGFKISRWFQGRLGLHSFNVDEISTRYSWGLNGKKETVSSWWLCILEADELHSQKGDIKFVCFFFSFFFFDALIYCTYSDFSKWLEIQPMLQGTLWKSIMKIFLKI